MPEVSRSGSPPATANGPPDTTDDDDEARWAATFMDRHGNITIRRHTSASLSRPAGYGLRVTARSSGQRDSLDRLAALFGGAVTHTGYTSSGRPRWAWALSGSKAAQAITVIRPYLTRQVRPADIAVRPRMPTHLALEHAFAHHGGQGAPSCGAPATPGHGSRQPRHGAHQGLPAT